MSNDRPSEAEEDLGNEAEHSIHESLADLSAHSLGDSIDLVRAAQDGSQEALSRLLDRYQSRVHRIARVRMGSRVRTYMDSADVVQETLVTAANNIRKLEIRDHSSVIRWMYALLENQILTAASYTRAKKRDPARAVALEDLRGGEEDRSGFDPALSAEGPASAASRREIADILDEEVAQLPDQQREVILWRDYYQADWSEIASKFERTVGAVQQLHLRARLRLGPAITRRLQG